MILVQLSDSRRNSGRRCALYNFTYLLT